MKKMEMTRKNSEETILASGQLLRDAASILVVSHIRPDGDAVGALLGLGLSLLDAGKKVQMILVDGVPPSMRHLAGHEKIIRQPKGEVDLRVVLDCSDLQRTGLIFATPPDLNIDHHITNLDFARVNLVEPTTEATSAILTENLESWGFPIHEQAAKALLTGIVSDTLGFRTSNTTPKALRLAANLMEKGADLPDLYNRALVRRSFESARFWGAALDQLQRDDGLVWTTLRLSDRNRVNYPGNDDADLVNFLSTIDDFEVAVVFVEQKEGNVKVSWRAQPGVDISKIALRFGGGGHPAASGAMITGPLDEVQDLVLRETYSFLNSNPAPNGKKSTASLEEGGNSLVNTEE